MFLKISIAIALIFAAFLSYVALQPSEMNISRELFIKAEAESIFPFINNSSKTNTWMPWADSDPGVKMIYSGPDEGQGSTSSWDSKGKMGTGQAVIIESIPNRSVKTQLTYTKPMQMTQIAELTLTPSEGGTLVRWSVSGHNTFLSRIFCVFMDMDKMVGGEFEKGLAKLKSLVEST